MTEEVVPTSVASTPLDYAFIFTDIEGSTKLLTLLGDAYPAVLEKHRMVVATAFENFGGRIVDCEGDANFVMFAEPEPAIRGCVEAQGALRACQWPGDVAVTVRMGVHVGPAWLVQNKPCGLGVHHAARVAATAHGGQIVVSARAASATHGFDFVDLGMASLKDVPEPMQLFQVVAPGLPGTFPPLRAERLRQGNLPRFLTSFVGRADGVDAIAALARAEPLVTILGPGGMGKTRLAIEGARAAEIGFPGGAWFADFGSVNDPAQIAGVLATSLGIVAGDAERSELDSVIEVLNSSRTLLVVDNCEHLLELLARTVGELLGRCPETHVVATSRQPLGLPGERQWHLEALSPDAAGELFTTRARLVEPDFTADHALLTRLCEQLDRLPLALELAAARVRTFDLVELSRQLSTSGRLLRGPDSMPERQRSVAATIDWSVRLLDPVERTLLAELSVFPGSFTVRSVEEVTAHGEQLYELLDSLVTKSLVSTAADDTDRRFRLLDLVRAHARTLIADEVEWNRVSLRHADFVIRTCEALRPVIEGPEPAAGLVQLSALEPDLRAAYATVTAARDDRRILALVAASGPLGLRNAGILAETPDWIDAALSIPPALDPQRRLDVLALASTLWLAAPARLREICEEGLHLARTLNDPVNEGIILSWSVWLDEQDRVGALAKLERAVSLIPAATHPGVAGVVAYSYVNLLRRDGQFEKAMGVLDQLDHASPTGLGLYDARLRYHRGLIHFVSGRLEEAHYWFNEALNSARRTGSVPGLEVAEWGLGLLARDSNDPDSAAGHFRRAYEYQRQLGGMERGDSLAMLIEAELRRGDLESAEQMLPDLKKLVGEGEGLVTAAPDLTRFVEGQLHLARGRRQAARDAFHDVARAGLVHAWYRGAREALDFLADMAEQDGDGARAKSYRQEAAQIPVR